MKYKLIALDLDGTLTNTQKEITPLTKNELIELAKKGVKIVLASGRPTAGIYYEADLLNLKELEGYILSFNGARIIDYKTGEVMYENIYGPDVVKKVYDRAKQYHLSVLTYQDRNVITEDESDKYIQEEHRINKMDIKHVDDFKGYVDFNVNKLLLTGDPEYVGSIIDEFKEPFGDTLSIYRSAPYFIEVMGPGIDKAQSLDALAKKLNIKQEEVIAFGDGYNDLSMIEYAGLGVAMANAVDGVKERANYVTLSNDEDGIYDCLKKLEEKGEI